LFNAKGNVSQSCNNEIIVPTATVLPIVLTQVWNEMEYNLDTCKTVDGAHTKLYCITLKPGDIYCCRGKTCHNIIQ
jgi:hypothetical protein